MRVLLLLLLLAACGTESAITRRDGEEAPSARIGFSGAALYSFTR